MACFNCSKALSASSPQLKFKTVPFGMGCEWPRGILRDEFLIVLGKTLEPMEFSRILRWSPQPSPILPALFPCPWLLGSAKTTCPKYATFLFPMSHLLLCQHTLHAYPTSPKQWLDEYDEKPHPQLYMRISSKRTRINLHEKGFNTSFISDWKVADALVSLKSMTRDLQCPSWVRKTVLEISSSLTRFDGTRLQIQFREDWRPMKLIKEPVNDGHQIFIRYHSPVKGLLVNQKRHDPSFFLTSKTGLGKGLPEVGLCQLALCHLLSFLSRLFWL